MSRVRRKRIVARVRREIRSLELLMGAGSRVYDVIVGVRGV